MGHIADTSLGHVCRTAATPGTLLPRARQFEVAFAWHPRLDLGVQLSLEPRLRRLTLGAVQERLMQYVCDASPNTWFRFETEAEAALESRAMNHAVEKYFQQARELAAQSYVPPKTAHYIEQNIGLKAHIQQAMPRFLTLRDGEGKALVTAMLPPKGQDEHTFKPIIVGFENSDPYPEYGDAIAALGKYLGLTLDHARCYPYYRG